MISTSDGVKLRKDGSEEVERPLILTWDHAKAKMHGILPDRDGTINLKALKAILDSVAGGWKVVPDFSPETLEREGFSLNPEVPEATASTSGGAEITSRKIEEFRKMVKEAAWEASVKPTRHKNHLGPEFDGWGAQTHHIDALCEVLRTTDALLVLQHLLDAGATDK